MIRETTEDRTREKWKRAMDIFEQALEQGPAQRDEFINSACANDAALRRMVTEIADSHQQAETEGFLESPAWSYSPPDLNPREMVGRQVGSYRLTQFLDQGGMGVIYLAEPADGFFRRQAAVKLIRADLGPKQYRRFRREVQILADLKHPNLVFLYEAGRMADGRPYLAMEYVEGKDLRDWQRRGVMPLPMAVEVIRQACAGLSAAHEAGIIHRDIKPSNIIVSENDGKLTVKVLDFGIAARKDDGSEMSSTQGVIGTVLYMSPEQLQGRKRDELTPASDIYSLGLTAYELLTGQPAISGDSQAEIIAKHLYDQPTPPSQLRPGHDLPTAVDRVVMKALAKNPQERYQSALEFAAALETASVKSPPLPETVSFQPRPIPAPHPQPPQPPPPAPNGGWKRFAKPVAAAVAVAAVSLAAYLVWMKAQNAPPDVGQATPAPSVPVQADQGKQLKIQVEVKNPLKLPYNSCAFALYRPEVQAVPARTGQDNAHVILIGIGAASAPKHVNYESVTPGEYLVKFACEGFKTFSGKVQVAEDQKSRGYATVSVPLERE
jgi:serine/threonine-protein kinase